LTRRARWATILSARPGKPPENQTRPARMASASRPCICPVACHRPGAFLGVKNMTNGTTEGMNPGRRKEYFREYRETNKEKIKKCRRKYRETNKEKIKEYLQKYRMTNMQQLRQTLLQALGGKCVRCGFSDERVLQIDHVNNNGAQHRRKKPSAYAYYKGILENIDSGEYQLLCPNCNRIKYYEWRRG